MTDDDQAPRGLAIDDAEMPPWARRYFTPDQLGLSRGLQWILLIYKSKRLESSRRNVAQRLHVHMEGRTRKAWNPSQASLAEDLDLSLTTVGVSLDELEEQGWLLVHERRRNKSWYRLAWPVADVLAPEAELEATCGQPTKKGGLCTRKAGRGTKTPGVGPCVLHGGAPRNDPGEPAEDAGDEAPGNHVDPQPLEQNNSPESSSAPTAEELTSNRWSIDLQPLEHLPPAVGDEYVQCVPGSLGVEESPVLAVGELTVRTARGSAPSAQPETSFTARSIITGIARYRSAPGWARKQHLVPMVAAALAAGFGRDAIERYAHLVAAEGRFLEHQHIPELREVLRRLGRDAALEDLCPGCGQPTCACPAPTAVADRPWTKTDQADWEAILDRLGVTPDQLTPEGAHA